MPLYLSVKYLSLPPHHLKAQGQGSLSIISYPPIANRNHKTDRSIPHGEKSTPALFNSFLFEKPFYSGKTPL